MITFDLAWIEASRVKARDKLAADKLMVQLAYNALTEKKRKELATHEDKGKAYIDAIIERHREFIEKLVGTELARRKAVAEKQADLTKALKLNLNI